MWIKQQNGKDFWAEGTVEPTLKNTVWQPELDSAVSNPAAAKYEQQIGRGRQLRPVVYTGNLTKSGAPETVQFDAYRNTLKNPLDLIDAKFRMDPKGASIYNPSRSNFHRDMLAKKVYKQEEARQVSGAKTVTWIVSDKELGLALRTHFQQQKWTTFRVLIETAK